MKSFVVLNNHGDKALPYLLTQTGFGDAFLEATPITSTIGKTFVQSLHNDLQLSNLTRLVGIHILACITVTS